MKEHVKDLFTTVIEIALAVYCALLGNWWGAVGFVSAAFFAFMFMKEGHLFDRVDKIANESMDKWAEYERLYYQQLDINRALMKEMNHE